MDGVNERGALLLQAMEDLRKLLEAETAAVKARDVAYVASIAPQKLEVVGRYERESFLFQQIARETPPPGAFKERLAAAAERLDADIAANAVALLAARDSHQTVIDLIVTEANRQRATGSGYTAKGAAPSDVAPRRRAAIPVTYNVNL